MNIDVFVGPADSKKKQSTHTSVVSGKKTLYSYWGHKCIILFKILESKKMFFF